MPHKGQVEALRDGVYAFASNSGESICKTFDTSAELLLLWYPYLEVSEKTNVADELLYGFKSAVIEAAACASLGLIRPTLFSIRAQMDMLFTWLYFRDHPIEWKYLGDTGNGFMLKSDVLKYLETYYVGFRERFSILLQGKKRSTADPYRLLSAHVHSQSAKAVPFLKKLSDALGVQEKSEEAAAIEAETAEYLNDVLLSCFAPKWVNLPKLIVQRAQARLNAAQKNVLFA